jgi:hypothetical protein
MRRVRDIARSQAALWNLQAIGRAAALALLLAGGASAVTAAADNPAHRQPARGPGNLKQVGALHCLASKAQGAPTTKLTCDLKLSQAQAAQKRYEGIMFGEGLYLVSPGPVRVLWNVLAPTRLLEPTALAGDYDIVSKHGFAYARENRNVLVGGMDDVVGLELISPQVDAITPSTRLTLRSVD